MKRLFKLVCVFEFLVILISDQAAFTQPPPLRFQHLAVEQGLSNSSVVAITQDRYGLMWIGTADGLNRFDGYNVEVFRNEHGNKNSLPDNSILSLFTDSRSKVWIGTANGLACYDDHTNSFRSFFLTSGNKNSIPSNSNVIGHINEDVRGILWIGTRDGLYSFDVKNNSFQQFVHDIHSNSISSNIIRGIQFASDGTMWISTDNGLNRLDLSTMKFTCFYNDPSDSTSITGNNLGTIAIDKYDNLWVTKDVGLEIDYFNSKTNHARHYRNFVEKQLHLPVPVNYLRSVFTDRSGKLWVGSTRAGLHLLSPGENHVYDYPANPSDPNKLHSNTIFRMYQDRSGMIWLATGSGVERFNPDESKFIHYTIRTFDSPSPGYKGVNAITEDPGNKLWLGTSAGIFTLARNTGLVEKYKWPQNARDSLSVNSIRSILCDRQGNIWIGAIGGLSFFDPVHKTFRLFQLEKSSPPLPGNFITNIVSDKNGDLLIGTRGGLSIYHFSNHSFSNFKKDSLHPLLNDQINVVFEDNLGILWLGMRNSGLIKYDRFTRKLENYTKQGDDTTSIAANYVCSIAQDYKGIIWVGTAAGLCRFNERTRKFTTFTEKNGLPNARISQLLVDDKNRIWMGTQKGISMLNETRTLFTNYDPGDGLQGWEFSEPSAFKTHDGYFCYGGTNGFNLFHPDSIKKNSFIPAVVLRRIMIFDDPLSMDSSFPDLKSLKLSYKQNFFSFEFAALNYDHPEKNQYAYQLIGFDKKVVHNGTNRVISYTNVPPGNYTLKVTASNNDQVWNKKGYELQLTIIPPFWATWWFKTIAVIVLLAAVFLFFKLRENRIKKEQLRQTAINKQIAEIRMTALRGQMNPHFIFNSLNSIQHFITIRDKEEALSYLSKFSKLIRKILENSRENTVSISNELELLELYIQLEQLRFNNKFDYHIEVDEKIDIENTEIPPLLIQPYIENAILHGLINKEGKGDLWVSLAKSNGLLICKIEDSGIGRLKAHEIEQKKVSRHKSLGIVVTEERISGLFALLDYKMEVVTEDLFETEQSLKETPQPAGTRVTISIPLKEEE